jgi:hypothetical protein
MIEKIQFLRNYIYEIIFKLSRLRSFLKDSILNLIFYRNYNRDYFSIAIVARLIKNHIFIFDRKYFDTLLIAFYISKIKFLVFHFFLDFSVRKFKKRKRFKSTHTLVKTHYWLYLSLCLLSHFQYGNFFYHLET